MKTKIHFLHVISFVTFFTSIINAQTTWTPSGTNIYNPNSGNVGIGNASPVEKLDVNNGSLKVNGYPIYLAWDHYHGLGFFGSGSNAFTSTGNYATKDINGPVLFGWSGGALGSNNNNVKNIALSWKENGYVGIGVFDAIQALDIKGSMRLSGGIQKGGTTPLAMNDLGLYSQDASWIRIVSTNQPILFYTDGGIGTTPVMTIQPNGNIGIGVDLWYNPNGYKLGVAGTIGAKAIKVEITSGTFPDFVFKKEYKLMPLEQVELFIKANQHLPEIPTAIEIEKNGLDLGELVKLQMKKIEELTLYMIELQKQNELMKIEIEKIKSVK